MGTTNTELKALMLSSEKRRDKRFDALEEKVEQSMGPCVGRRLRLRYSNRLRTSTRATGARW